MISGACIGATPKLSNTRSARLHSRSRGEEYSRDKRQRKIQGSIPKARGKVALDIHHIFPRDWCEKQGISRDRYDSILNKTPISYKANRKVGGDAPSVYLPRIQKEKQVQLDDVAMDDLLASHALAPPLLRSDAFDAFLEDRRERLGALVERAMGKPVVRLAEAASAGMS